MLKLSALGLLLIASGSFGQSPPPTVRPILTHEQAQGLSRDPTAVLADPAAVAALSAFVTPLQQHAPLDPNRGEIGAVLDEMPETLMLPVEVSGAMLWVSVSTNPPADAIPPGLEGGSELALDRFIVEDDAEPVTDAQAVCPPDGLGYHVWTVDGVGPVEGCVMLAE